MFPTARLLQQQRHPWLCGYIRSRRPLASSTTTNVKPPGKFKIFMKKYGYVGAGVYTVLSVVDLSLTMAIISVKGAERVKKAEDYVLLHVKRLVGLPHKRDDHYATTEAEQPSLTTIFLAAYGIHKTLLLPIRLSITAAITPKIARSIRELTRK